MNNAQFLLLKKKGKAAMRPGFVAHHTPTATNIRMPTDEISQQLFSYTPAKKNKLSPTYIDLCIGSNIMLTDNIAAEIGLTNGTLGTVIAFQIQLLHSVLQKISFNLKISIQLTTLIIQIQLCLSSLNPSQIT